MKSSNSGLFVKRVIVYFVMVCLILIAVVLVSVVPIVFEYIRHKRGKGVEPMTHDDGAPTPNGVAER